MERQDLQFDRHVDLTHEHAPGHVEHGRCEVEDRTDTRCDQSVGRILGCCRRRRDDADHDPTLGDESRQLVLVVDGDLTQLLTDLARIDVDHAHHRETPVAEPGELGECGTQVAGADDHTRPVMGEAELTSDLDQELVDVVPDSAGSVGAEVGQVLADLRRVHPRQLGELFRGGLEAVLGLHLQQTAVVHGQTCDRRFRDDTASGLRHGSKVPPLFTSSQSRPGSRGTAHLSW